MEAIKRILRTPSAFVLFLVAIVSLIGIMIKSETDKAIARMPIDATSTAEARLTEIADFSRMTQSANFPPVTWSPSPTETKTPTLPPSSTTTATDFPPSTLLLQDDFIDNRNDWHIQKNQRGIESNIIGGKYIHSISCPAAYFTLYCEYSIVVPNLLSRPKDLQFELDATIKNLSSNAEVIIVFQFRKDYSNRYYNFYDVYFSNTGRYTVDIFYNGSWDNLLESTITPSLSPSTNAVNRYGFSIVNTVITPLFNSHELPSVEDGNISQGGVVYVAILVSRGGSAVVELDNAIAIDKSE